MRNHLTVLHQRLREFGLDPVDWCIEVRSILASVEKIEISSVDDGGIRLEGWARRDNWLRISYHG